MRPVRLEMAGFGSFKEPVDLDLESAEFFALVGPTGSGKSTIIDALCFALYGSVPRYENRNLVAPVISQGKLEAKVRLDFTVGGSTYTAVRVVRRAGKGATTKEARLERDGDPLASGPDELTEAVGDLLGLGFDHFTKCVVLPQGEFARFLHDKPADRHGLVVRLLNLGIYEQMGQAARQRAAVKKVEIQGCIHQLEDLETWAALDRLHELAERSSKLKELRRTAARELPKIERLAEVERRADERSGEAHEWVATLDKLEVPADIEDLAERLTSAHKDSKESERSALAARKTTEAAESARKGLGERRVLDRALDAHDRRTRVSAELGPVHARIEKLAARVDAARKALSDSELEESEAREAQKRVQSEHRAQHMASELEKGKPCPVCLQKVEALPHYPAALGLKDADERVDAATRSLAKARASLDTEIRELAKVEGNAASLRNQLQALDREIVQHPNAKALTKLLQEIDAAETAVEEARRDEGRARDRAEAAVKSLRSIEERQARARAVFDEARFALAQLDPPAVSRESLVDDWRALVTWADKKVAELTREEAKAAKEGETARTQRLQSIDELMRSCADCRLDVQDEVHLRDEVVAAHTSAENEKKQVEEALGKVEKMREKISTLELEQSLAEELGLHLSNKAGRFPGWIVNAALERLVNGATEILEELSQGQYALATDEHGNFLVIDRNNANERRSARTLSGGETFLASLSLALALADQLADLAAEGAARLEAIFLDEGFGTLDPETLDTVAATVENLAAGGRMVGVVTHVRELAERVPLQFRVRKNAGTSTIERVIA